jgi:hypothetical protein
VEENDLLTLSVMVKELCSLLELTEEGSGFEAGSGSTSDGRASGKTESPFLM